MSVSSVKNLNGVTFSAVQDYSLTDFIQTNSGSWGGGSVDTIPVVAISPLVTGFSGESAYLGIESTALNLSSYVPVSSIGYNGSYISTISGNSISSYTGRYAMTANYANTADRAYKDRNSNEITSYYQPKLTIAGENGTITAINSSAVGATIPEGWELVAGQGIEIVDDSQNNQTTISVTAAGGNPEVESYVQTNSASIDDAVSSYQINSAVFNAKQDALTFSTATTLSAASNYGYRPTTGISGIGGSALIIPMAVIQYWNPRTLNYASAINQIYKDRIAADLDGQGNYIKDTYQKVSGVSATEWNDATTAYQTNSGTYMSEPNLEYNAVNEISAYNGSAIAQYGAEKQWLVHDDTLVHISNSAQYALGCNISALQRLMGIDETVLWSGNATTTNFPLTLNEPMSSFETIKFYWQTFNYNAKNWTVSEKIPVGSDNYYTLFDGIYNTGTKSWFDVAFAFKEENGKLNYLSGAYRNWTNTTVGDANSFLSMFKIVGIGRKQ